MIDNSSSVIELSRTALATNIHFIRQLVGENVIISSVLKGNAYGHGIKQMVPELENLGIKHFSVFGSFEAMEVKQHCQENTSIMIMGDIIPSHFSWIIEEGVECFVFNFERLETLCSIARTLKKKARIHLELETGMNRTGFAQKYWEELAKSLQEKKDCLEVIGICTHFAGAESVSNFKRIQRQKKVFDIGVAFFKTKNIIARLLHTSCSAAVIAYPENNFDMVRVGILQYGLWPSKEIQVSYFNDVKKKEDPLKRVISWKSHVMDVKEVQMGEFVGYGTSFLAEYDMKIASVPVGYSYGFSRSLSNQGHVVINGKRLNVVGIVNMNMFVVEVTHADVKVGDQVTLIGKEGETTITVSHFGNLSDQMNYELLTRLGRDIPRVVV